MYIVWPVIPNTFFSPFFRFFPIFDVFWSIQIKRISPCFSSHRDLSIHAITIPNGRYKLYFWSFFCFFRKFVFCFWWFWCFLLLPFKSNVTIVLFTPKTCVHAKYELKRMLFRSVTDKSVISISKKDYLGLQPRWASHINFWVSSIDRSIKFLINRKIDKIDVS